MRVGAVNRTKLKAMLVRDEGICLKPYRDSVGVLTLGVGRNLEDRGISDDEARYLLDNDINRCVAELPSLVPCFGALNDDRQHVLINMLFNLGATRLLKFTKFLTALEACDFATAAEEMLASKWAQQVGDRATRLATIMKGEN